MALTTIDLINDTKRHLGSMQREQMNNSPPPPRRARPACSSPTTSGRSRPGRMSASASNCSTCGLSTRRRRPRWSRRAQLGSVDRRRTTSRRDRHGQPEVPGLRDRPGAERRHRRPVVADQRAVRDAHRSSSTAVERPVRLRPGRRQRPAWRSSRSAHASGPAGVPASGRWSRTTAGPRHQQRPTSPSGIALFIHEGVPTGRRSGCATARASRTVRARPTTSRPHRPRRRRCTTSRRWALLSRLVAPREIKRNFTEAQGEPRRAAEVPPGAVASSMRTVAALRQQRITTEASRLLQADPPSQHTPTSAAFYGGGW